MEVRSFWDICDCMSSNIGGDGGGIWTVRRVALKGGL